MQRPGDGGHETSSTVREDAPLYAPRGEEGEQQLSGPVCWKCEGTGILRHRKRLQNPAAHAARYGATPPPCAVCGGTGRVAPKQKQRNHANDEGVITQRRWVPPEWERAVPGPPPAGIGHPNRGEELCFLTGGWRIFQCIGGHRFTTEDVVTAWVAARVSTPERALDLGTGIGSVLMMVAWRHPDASVVGVEAQELSASMAKRSLRYNGADAGGRCEVRRADIRDTADWLREGEAGSFDLVTGTPPYFPVTHVLATRETEESDMGETGATAASVAIGAIGALPTCQQSAPARYEFRGGIEAYCAAASLALRRPSATAGGGRFVVCEGFLEGNRARVNQAAAAAGLRILEQTDVIGREGKSPLFAVYVMSHDDDAQPSAAGGRTLIVREHGGGRTEEYKQLMSEMGMPCGVAGTDF